MNSYKDTYKIIDLNSEFGRSLITTYKKNLEVIQLHDPLTATVLEQQDFFEQWQLFTDDEFRYGLKNSQIKEEKAYTLLTDYDSIPDRQKKLHPVVDHTHYIVFFGTGIGELLLTIADYFHSHRNTHNSYLPNVWIIEPRPAFFKAMLMFMDLHDLWNNSQVNLFIGQDCFKRIKKPLKRIISPHNQMMMSVHPGPYLNKNSDKLKT